MMTTDTNQWTQGLTLVTDLIMDVSNKYRVDKDRIYGTGQSQGGMANIAISDAIRNSLPASTSSPASGIRRKWKNSRTRTSGSPSARATARPFRA